MQSLQESIFIGLLFFFWLLLMHTIASQDNIIQIDDAMFFIPKFVLCTMITLNLIMMRLYVYACYDQDPFFDSLKQRQMELFYNCILVIGIISSTVYMLYFGIISYGAIKTIKNLKSTYRYALGITIFVATISSMIMIQNGQASQRMDPPLFLSLYAMFNIYMYLMAYMYAPSDISNYR